MKPLTIEELTKLEEMALDYHKDKRYMDCNHPSTVLRLISMAKRAQGLVEALEQIEAFDVDPSLHHTKDASKCSICIAKKTMADWNKGDAE